MRFVELTHSDGDVLYRVAVHRIIAVIPEDGLTRVVIDGLHYDVTTTDSPKATMARIRAVVDA